MAVYSTQTTRFNRYVRADSYAQAVRLIRAIDGFCLRDTVRKVGENFAASVGSALAYDTAAAHLEGAKNSLAKKARMVSRTKTAHGKGATIPAGVEILTM